MVSELFSRYDTISKLKFTKRVNSIKHIGRVRDLVLCTSADYVLIHTKFHVLHRDTICDRQTDKQTWEKQYVSLGVGVGVGYD